MTGRRGLGWVTALTIASLLLGGGALTAFAEHGDKGSRGGHGNPAAHQQVQQQHHEVEVEQRPDDQVQAPRATDDDDLITQPDRVTDEVRPGKGCGDDNHEHERNDDCKPNHDNNDDDQGNAVGDDD